MIIKSLLDNDLYKFTMQQAVLHQFTNTEVEYKFVCRNKNISFARAYAHITTNIAQLAELQLTEDEAHYLQSIRYIKRDYIDFLKLFRFHPDQHITTRLRDDNALELTVKGSWLYTILYEVPLLSIINESWFHFETADEKRAAVHETGLTRLAGKINLVKQYNSTCAAHTLLKFIEFGTRRRYALDWQDKVIAELKRSLPENITGTSNVHFAMQYNLTPVGTMAHEWIMAGQAQEVRLVNSQKLMLEKWVSEYRGDLGIALTDTICMDAFLRDFDLYFSKLYDGCRHDSGDPYTWCDKLLKHYASQKIDPATKSAVFSDGLDFPAAIALHKNYADKIRTSFGIGTNLTNDLGLPALNIVIKMCLCNGQKIAKLSDAPGKSICDDEAFLSYLKNVFGYYA